MLRTKPSPSLKTLILFSVLPFSHRAMFSSIVKFLLVFFLAVVAVTHSFCHKINKEIVLCLSLTQVMQSIIRKVMRD